MEKYRFWFEKPKDEEGISRDLEHNLYNDGSYQTVPQPQNMNTYDNMNTYNMNNHNMNTYDPWADWFNAGLDPEPLTNNFGTESEQNDYFNYGVNPSYDPLEPGQTVPWQTVPWDQALNPLWFQEGQESQNQTQEPPAGESVEQYRPDQDEGTGAWEGANFSVAEPAIPMGEGQPMAEYPYGSSGLDQAWTGDSGLFSTETGVASGISVVEEAELKEETGLEEEAKVELKEETTVKFETESKEEPQFKEENRSGEEPIGKEATNSNETTDVQEQIIPKAESEHKEGIAGKVEPVSIEALRDEPKSGQGQSIIVWRKFPPKSI